MRELLRYIYTRATTTKNWRAYNNEQAIPRYNQAIDLTSVTIGQGLAFTLVVVLGAVAKSGPSILVSTWIAVVINTLAGLCFAELRSRFARVQATAYEYTNFAIGNVAAFVMAWLQLLKDTMCTSAIAKTISIYTDFATDMSIRNFTTSRLGTEQANESYLDFLAFAMTLSVMIVVFLSWYKQYVKLEIYYKLLVVGFVLVLLFLLGVAASHVKFVLWKTTQFHTFTVCRNAAIILLAISSTHHVFSMSDFVWLGIKPTVLISYTVSTLFTPVLLSMLVTLLTLLSPWQSWITHAVIVEAFQNAGVTWLKFVIGPVLILSLPVTAFYHFKASIEVLQDLAFDNLIPTALQRSKSSKFPSFLATGLVGVGTSFAALSASIDTLLEIAALCVILQYIIICCLVTILRYRPSYHMHVISQSHREDSNLIGQNNNEHETAITGDHLDHIGDYLYGAFSNNNEESPVAIRNDGCHSNGEEENEDIDDAVEEFRLQSAVQCYKSALQTTVKLHKTPNKRSFKCIKITVITFTVMSLSIAFTLKYGWHELESCNIALILWLIFSILISVACVMLSSFQPKDKILPRTMLMQAPTSCVVVMVTILGLSLLAATPEGVTWTVCVIWLFTGLLCYLVNCVYSRGTSADLYGNLSAQRDAQSQLAQSSVFHSQTNTASTETDDEDGHLCTFSHNSMCSRNDDESTKEHTSLQAYREEMDSSNGALP